MTSHGAHSCMSAYLPGRRWQHPSNVGKAVALRQFEKTALCCFHTFSRCKKGSGCGFAHGESELQVTPNFAETSLCRAWEAGKCNRSRQRRRFAHGVHNLRRRSTRRERKGRPESCDKKPEAGDKLLEASRGKQPVPSEVTAGDSQAGRPFMVNITIGPNYPLVGSLAWQGGASSAIQQSMNL